MIITIELTIPFLSLNVQEEIRSSPSNLLMNNPSPNEAMMPVRGIDDLPKPPAANRREIMHSIFFILFFYIKKD